MAFIPLRNSVVLGIFSRAELAKDAHVPEAGSGFRGFSLAHNVRSEAEADAVMEDARKAGAVIVKPCEKVFWGGYSGYFSDPDGFLWEVAYNPGWTLKEDGSVELG